MSLDYGRPQGRRAAIAVGIVCALLYLVVGGRLTIFGSVPAYLLVLTATVAFVEGERAGCVAGFTAGLVSDLLGAGPVGLSSLLMCVAGYALGFARRDYLADGWTHPLARFAVADVAYTAVYLVVASFMGGTEAGAAEIASAVAGGAACDVAVGAIAFILVYRYLARRTTRVPGLYLS